MARGLGAAALPLNIRVVEARTAALISFLPRGGVATVRELYGVMAARGAAGGIVVRAGDFTHDALEFASGRNIELLNGRVLSDILRPSVGLNGEAARVDGPRCPNCGSRMMKCTARKGPTAGQSFWGCETYTGCRATRPI
jgi:restriction system protein